MDIKKELFNLVSDKATAVIETVDMGAALATAVAHDAIESGTTLAATVAGDVKATAVDTAIAATHEAELAARRLSYRVQKILSGL